MAFIGNTNTTQAFTPAIDYFSGNGSTTAFTLSRPVASVAQVQVTIDNVAQNPSSAFTVSANTITFTSAPLSGTNNIYVYYTSPITQVIAPSQGTVQTAQLGNITNIASGNSSLTLQTGSSNTTAITVDASQKVSFTNPIQGGSITSGTAVATTSGTSINFTSIPSWVKRITVMLAGVSTNGSSSHILQIGDSGGIENTSYVGSALTSGGAGGAFTTGYGLTKDTGSTSLTTGVAVIALLNSSTNLWSYSFCGAFPNDNTMVWGGGYKALSGVLDRIRLTTVNGTDTFDAGSINILYEG